MDTRQSDRDEPAALLVRGKMLQPKGLRIADPERANERRDIRRHFPFFPVTHARYLPPAARYGTVQARTAPVRSRPLHEGMRKKGLDEFRHGRIEVGCAPHNRHTAEFGQRLGLQKGLDAQAMNTEFEGEAGAEEAGA